MCSQPVCVRASAAVATVAHDFLSWTFAWNWEPRVTGVRTSWFSGANVQLYQGSDLYSKMWKVRNLSSGWRGRREREKPIPRKQCYHSEDRYVLTRLGLVHNGAHPPPHHWLRHQATVPPCFWASALQPPSLSNEMVGRSGGGWLWMVAPGNQTWHWEIQWNP